MRFQVLGPIEVAADGHRADLGSGHRRTILAVLLAARGATVATDRLIDAVWGDDPPVSARRSLQSHVSRLRGALAAVDGVNAPLVSAGAGYRIDLDAQALDARRFERLVADARAAARTDPRQATELLDEALLLWRGPAFGELASAAGVDEEATRLELQRDTALADHVDLRLALGRHREVLGELQARVTTHPLDERAHAQLMLALYRDGRQADALATYRRLLRRLRDEVGVDPSPALRQLHGRVLQQDAGLDGPGPREATDLGASPSPDVPPTTLDPPRPVVRAPELIGREPDVTAVTEAIPDHPLVTLVGPGGVGKTRLAERVAGRLSGVFTDGVVTCSLAGVRSPDDVGEAVITMLGIRPTGARSVTETVVAALGERRLLLLLDNCEHLLAPVAELVEAIVARCPEVAILATSRERLHLPVELVRPVAPLAVPEAGVDPEDVAATPACALFLVRARAVEPELRLDRPTADAVGELCRRLDGMPLAIELAAARVRALTPSDLVARLDRRFSLLAGGPRHEAGRHRTLEAVVAWSYELLETAEATLFDRLSVFAGSFSLEAAEAVSAGRPITADEVAGLLGGLVDKSMVVVQRREGHRRYRLLDTLRDFGARRLADAGHPGSLQRAHASFHLALVEELGPMIRGPEERSAVAGIDAAFDDLRAAHAWLVTAGDIDGALRLPAALVEYAFYRLRDEVTTLARRALELPGAAGSPAYAAALACAARGATSRDECSQARREAQGAFDHAGADDLAALSALASLGTAALYEGRLDDVLAVARRHLAIADRMDDDFARAFGEVLRVLAHVYRGDQDAAVGHLRELDAAAEASGSPTMRAFARYCRGETHLETDPPQAAASFEDAVELARSVDNALIEGVSLVSLASSRGRHGDTDAALRLFRRVIAHWRRLGDHTHQLTTIRNLVDLLARTGAGEPAAVLYGAVTGGLAPSFGSEAQRLAAAWAHLERRLGGRAAAAAHRGRHLTTTQMEDVALAQLAALIDT